LGGDRQLHLIAQAHAGGLLNYAEFDPGNNLHIAKERILFTHLEKEESKKLLGYKLIRQSAVQAYSHPLDREGIINKAATKRALATYLSLCEACLPWIKWQTQDSGKISENEGMILQRKWEKAFGSLSSPEVQRKLQEYVANDRKLSLAEETPTGATILN